MVRPAASSPHINWHKYTPSQMPCTYNDQADHFVLTYWTHSNHIPAIKPYETNEQPKSSEHGKKKETKRWKIRRSREKKKNIACVTMYTLDSTFQSWIGQQIIHFLISNYLSNLIWSWDRVLFHSFHVDDRHQCVHKNVLESRDSDSILRYN